jgi:cystathionine beta-lyase/cystathionine gamma-synthase
MKRTISELESAASSVVFSSGIAAISATLGVTLKSGDVLVMPAN